MTLKGVRLFLPATLAILTAAGMALAKSYDVAISRPSELGSGPMIKAGSYKVEIMNIQSRPEAVFFQHGKEVAEVPVKLVNTPKKSSVTEYTSDDKNGKLIITEMQLEGLNERVLFQGASTSHKSNP